MTSDNQHRKPSLAAGQAMIRDYAGKLPDTPGVYRMLGAGEEALYVGKAKSLKKRVSSYTKVESLPHRLKNMVSLTRRMEFIHTRTEIEALLLEANLIKKLKPRFNILLRDDKSFPFIVIAQDHDFPLIRKHRGAQKAKGKYFGPFASAGDVNETLAVLQRAFLLRNCPDTVFANRTRPCLQYHIKRCTAPCVGKVSKADYARQVRDAQDFLEGRSREIQSRLEAAMVKASAAMDYEAAALLRDRIRALTAVQAYQNVQVGRIENVDVVALAQAGGQSCVQVFFFRDGQNFGNHSFFPAHTAEETPEDILAAFLAQFYDGKPVPADIFVNGPVRDKGLLEDALSLSSSRRVRISQPVKGQRAQLMAFAVNNAQAALARNLSGKAQEAKLLQGAAEVFGLEEPPQRVEVYDNSHISGAQMVGVMIVSGPEGLQKNAYRKFNIKTAKAADDVGMMREVLTRRFQRAQEEGAGGLPDLVLIDGGRAQFNAARAVMTELGIFDAVPLVAIAKGEDRHAGRETFFMAGKKPFQLPPQHPVLHYLQRLRDEAHRFAIGSHRGRMQRQISTSPLDDIPGIGAKRKKALLHHFGSAKAVADARTEDLRRVAGISAAFAQKIYDHFH